MSAGIVIGTGDIQLFSPARCSRKFNLWPTLKRGLATIQRITSRYLIDETSQLFAFIVHRFPAIGATIYKCGIVDWENR